MSNLPKIPDDEYLSVSKEGLEYILANFDVQVPDRNFLWTTDYRVELPVRVKKGGPGSEHPYTLVEMWRESLAKFGQHGALTYETAPNQWRTITYRQYYDLSVNFARSLIALGISEYTAVNIIGYNSVEWAVAFYGSIFGHYLPIGLYTTNNPDACAYIANHS
jgi:long-chain-fatty-acid--CoA ligase ACSBG